MRLMSSGAAQLCRHQILCYANEWRDHGGRAGGLVRGRRRVAVVQCGKTTIRRLGRMVDKLDHFWCNPNISVFCSLLCPYSVVCVWRVSTRIGRKILAPREGNRPRSAAMGAVAHLVSDPPGDITERCAHTIYCVCSRAVRVGGSWFTLTGLAPRWRKRRRL